MPFLAEIRSKKRQILALAAQNGVRDIRLFGSVAREEEHSDSDVDFLVSVETGRRLTDLCRFRLDVSALIGRECDVVSERGLHPMLREKILSEARPL